MKPIKKSVLICRKVRFTSEALAKTQLSAIREKSTRKKVPIRVYLCKCGFWHLTSRPDSFELESEVSTLKLENASLSESLKKAKEQIKEQSYVLQSLRDKLRNCRADKIKALKEIIELRRCQPSTKK
jgi:hypothetical protein